jgi:hypothetical protein
VAEKNYWQYRHGRRTKANLTRAATLRELAGKTGVRGLTALYWTVKQKGDVFTNKRVFPLKGIYQGVVV